MLNSYILSHSEAWKVISIGCGIAGLAQIDSGAIGIVWFIASIVIHQAYEWEGVFTKA